MTTGQRIAYLRKRNSMTQPMLAEKMNVSQSTVTSWETDRRNVGNEDLVKLADLFHVTTDYILGHNVKLDENVTVAAHLDGELKDMDAETQQEIHEYIEFKKAQYAKKHSQKD